MSIEILLIIIYVGIVFHAVLAAITAKKGGDFRGGFQRLNVTIAAFAFLISYRLIFEQFSDSVATNHPGMRIGSAIFLLAVVIINHILVVIGHRKHQKEHDERNWPNNDSI